jgi:hypothetical protein
VLHWLRQDASVTAHRNTTPEEERSLEYALASHHPNLRCAARTGAGLDYLQWMNGQQVRGYH